MKPTLFLPIVGAVMLAVLAGYCDRLDHPVPAPVAAAPAPITPPSVVYERDASSEPEDGDCGSDEDCYHACLDWYSDDGLGEVTPEVEAYCADPFGKAEPTNNSVLRTDI